MQVQCGGVPGYDGVVGRSRARSGPAHVRCRIHIRRFKVNAKALAKDDLLERVAKGGVVIGGAGIAGLATASALYQVGIPAVVLERDAGPRLEGSAIGLWPNAFRALDALGVAAPLREAHSLLQRIELCSPNGSVLRKFHLDECSGAPHEMRGVLRKNLLKTLEDSLPAGTVRYNSQITEIRESSSGASVSLSNGIQVQGAVLMGADGARSEIAKHLNLAAPNYAGYSAYRGVAEFKDSLPVASDTVRQIVGRGVRAGMYPLSDRSVYWFIAMNCPQDQQVSQEDYQADASRLVAGWDFGIGDAIKLTPSNSITRSRIGDRWLLPKKSFGKGRVTAAGDAAHPMTPNLGQGGCTALEDAVVFAQTLKAIANGGTLSEVSNDEICKSLRDFEAARSLRVTKITVRSNLMGRLLSADFGPICSARDAVIQHLYPINTVNLVVRSREKQHNVSTDSRRLFGA